VLPAFLLARRSYAVAVVKQLVTTVLEKPHDWPQILDLDIDLATAYRWLRILTQQANHAMPEIRNAILQLKPDYQLTDQIDGKPPGWLARIHLLQRFISLAQQLHTEALRLVDNNQPISADCFCFLNYFLADRTTKALLQN